MAIINDFVTPTVGSLIQVCLASLPLLGLLGYFLYLTYQRPSEECYNDALTEDKIGEACSLPRLADMVYVYIAVSSLWTVLACFLSVYVPRRRALIELYLTEGIPIIGNIYYKRNARFACSCLRVAKYGYVVYAHPHYEMLPVFIRHEVRLVELYSREGATLLLLKDRSFSAQPKEEMEIDSQILRSNEGKMTFFRAFAWTWVVFCYLAPMYILKTIYDLDKAGLYDFQPEYEGMRAMNVFLICNGLVIPILSYLINYSLWSMHERWMCWEHKIVEEKDADDDSWYNAGNDDDDEEEGSSYQPPEPSKQNSQESEESEELPKPPKKLDIYDPEIYNRAEYLVGRARDSRGLKSLTM